MTVAAPRAELVSRRYRPVFWSPAKMRWIEPDSWTFSSLGRAEAAVVCHVVLPPGCLEEGDSLRMSLGLLEDPRDSKNRGICQLSPWSVRLPVLPTDLQQAVAAWPAPAAADLCCLLEVLCTRRHELEVSGRIEGRLAPSKQQLEAILGGLEALA